MNKIIVLIFTLAFTSCINETNQDLIVNNWKFESIKNEKGEEIKPVSEGDYMEVKEDNTFYYKLNKAEIEASGSWKMLGDTSIQYTYNPKKEGADIVVRTYKINSVTFDNLVLFEKGIYYSFKN